MGKKSYFVLLIGLLLGFCCMGKASDRWLQRYSYLEEIRNSKFAQFEGDDEYFLVVLVNARHPDYSSPFAYVWDLTWNYIIENQPDTGHAWIVLSGKKSGKRWIFEGGHSVNCNAVMPGYVKKMIGLACEDTENNPARSLFNATNEGLFEYGSGNNKPTFAAAFPLTKDGFDRTIKILENYQFENWGLRGPNCVQLVQTCLSAVGVDCSLYDTVDVPETINFFGNQVRLWSDPSYARLPVKTPDLLEKRLFDLVKTKQASAAMHWYTNFNQHVRKGLLSTNEISVYPKVLASEINGDSVTIRCADLIEQPKEEVLLLEVN